MNLKLINFYSNYSKKTRELVVIQRIFTFTLHVVDIWINALLMDIFNRKMVIYHIIVYIQCTTELARCLLVEDRMTKTM